MAPTRHGERPVVQAKTSVAPPIRNAVIQRAGSDDEADDEDSDDEHPGLERLRRTNARGIVGHHRGGGPARRRRLGRVWRDHPYQRHEEVAKRWYDAGRNLPTEYIDTGFGQVTISRGRAEKAGPMTNTNTTQHPGTTLGTTYADVRRALNTGKAPLAKAILTYLRMGTNPTPGTFTPNQIRAAAAIIGISHISEEARFPGAAKLARALLKKIADRKMTFQEAFSDKWFPMVGSAGGLQGLLTAGDAGDLDDVLAGMSDSSGEEESSSESSDDEEAIPLGSFREEDKRRSGRLKSKETSSSGEGSPIRCRHCGYSNYTNEKNCERCQGRL